MKTILRSLLAVVAGLAIAFGMVIGVELFSSVVHPLPPNFDGNIPEHVRRYPDWVLGAVVLTWGVTFAIATWAATRIGNQVTGLIVGALLACALLLNLAMLPYVLWFKVAMIMTFPLACWAGMRFGQRPLQTG